MAKTRLSSTDYDSKWHVCGLHVEKAASFIAYFTIALDILIIILSIYFGKWGIGIVALFFMLVNFCILAAKHQRHANWYLPYLITNFIGLLMTIATIILLAYNLSQLPDWWMNWVDPTPERHFRSSESTDKVIWTTAVLLIFFVIYGLLYAFFQYVVWKAYKYMKKFPHGEPLRNITTTHDQGRLIINNGGTTTTGVVSVEETRTTTTSAMPKV